MRADTPISERWILDLCGGTGSWSKPYRDAGYRVTVIDPLAYDPTNPLTKEDRGSWDFAGRIDEWLEEQRKDAAANNDAGPVGAVWGVLFAPPCDEFAVCGARWWEGKDPALLSEALRTVRYGLNLIGWVKPEWWVMENPRGRLRRLMNEDRGFEARYISPLVQSFIKEPRLTFDPCDYGDPWTKKTLLWGDFTEPHKTPVKPTLNKVDGKGRQSSPIHRCQPGPLRKMLRSMTSPGFARSFFNANP